jgi:hypothetical protein
LQAAESEYRIGHVSSHNSFSLLCQQAGLVVINCKKFKYGRFSTAGSANGSSTLNGLAKERGYAEINKGLFESSLIVKLCEASTKKDNSKK